MTLQQHYIVLCLSSKNVLALLLGPKGNRSCSLWMPPLSNMMSFSISASKTDHPQVTYKKGTECQDAPLRGPKQPFCKYYFCSTRELQQPACWEEDYWGNLEHWAMLKYTNYIPVLLGLISLLICKWLIYYMYTHMIGDCEDLIVKVFNNDFYFLFNVLLKVHNTHLIQM